MELLVTDSSSVNHVTTPAQSGRANFKVEADDGATLYRFTFELVTVFMYIKDQKQNKQKKKIIIIIKCKRFV